MRKLLLGILVGVHGRYQVASNAIPAQLVWQTYQGKVLDRTLRERASTYLSDNNRIGFDLDFGIFAKHIPDSAKGIGWFVNIADRSHANAKYPRDMFDLAMFGNAMFAGETADLNDIRLTLITYKQFEVGLLKQVKREKGTWDLGVGLSLLTGNRSLSAEIASAELYTHPEGEYLEVHVKGSLRSSK